MTQLQQQLVALRILPGLLEQLAAAADPTP